MEICGMLELDWCPLHLHCLTNSTKSINLLRRRHPGWPHSTSLRISPTTCPPWGSWRQEIQPRIDHFAGYALVVVHADIGLDWTGIGFQAQAWQIRNKACSVRSIHNSNKRVWGSTAISAGSTEQQNYARLLLSQSYIVKLFQCWKPVGAEELLCSKRVCLHETQSQTKSDIRIWKYLS